ncbi:hypothetical protein BJ742DRAFT_798634 [Cladochytrium replicatum]|nr:hypothetical protein BJ742DRAFT_798634 [Cladochytrium replicatum]
MALTCHVHTLTPDLAFPISISTSTLPRSPYVPAETTEYRTVAIIICLKMSAISASSTHDTPSQQLPPFAFPSVRYLKFEDDGIVPVVLRFKINDEGIENASEELIKTDDFQSRLKKAIIPTMYNKLERGSLHVVDLIFLDYERTPNHLATRYKFAKGTEDLHKYCFSLRLGSKSESATKTGAKEDAKMKKPDWSKIEDCIPLGESSGQEGDSLNSDKDVTMGERSSTPPATTVVSGGLTTPITTSRKRKARDDLDSNPKQHKIDIEETESSPSPSRRGSTSAAATSDAKVDEKTAVDDALPVKRVKIDPVLSQEEKQDAIEQFKAANPGSALPKVIKIKRKVVIARPSIINMVTSAISSLFGFSQC